MDFYRDDFSQSDLETQLEVFSQMHIECARDSITFQGIYNSVSYPKQWSPIKSSCAFKHESTHLKMTCFLFDESVTSSDSSTKKQN